MPAPPEHAVAESHIIARVHASVLDVDPQAWNALLAQQAHATPFMRHEYLAALETSDSATPRTGWTPRFLTLWDAGAPRKSGMAIKNMPTVPKPIYLLARANSVSCILNP